MSARGMPLRKGAYLAGYFLAQVGLLIGLLWLSFALGYFDSIEASIGTLDMAEIGPAKVGVAWLLAILSWTVLPAAPFAFAGWTHRRRHGQWPQGTSIRKLFVALQLWKAGFLLALALAVPTYVMLFAREFGAVVGGAAMLLLGGLAIAVLTSLITVPIDAFYCWVVQVCRGWWAGRNDDFAADDS